MAAAPATFNSCSDSLKRKGRFKVRRIRSGSAEADDDDDDDDQVKKEKEQSPGAGGKVRFMELHPLLGSAAPATPKIVAVYNVSGLFSFDRRLATKYRLRDLYSSEIDSISHNVQIQDHRPASTASALGIFIIFLNTVVQGDPETNFCQLYFRSSATCTNLLCRFCPVSACPAGSGKIAKKIVSGSQCHPVC